MKWIIFTGTWRLTNEEVERDVREAVRNVLEQGDAIITGGALGVDWYCMDEALIHDPEMKRLLVIIPGTLEQYIEHFHNALDVGTISKSSFTSLEHTLREIHNRNPKAILELPYEEITDKEYFQRDQEEVDRADAIYAFQVNNSVGAQDTIDRGMKKGIPILLHKKYTILEI